MKGQYIPSGFVNDPEDDLELDLEHKHEKGYEFCYLCKAVNADLLDKHGRLLRDKRRPATVV